MNVTVQNVLQVVCLVPAGLPSLKQVGERVGQHLKEPAVSDLGGS